MRYLIAMIFGIAFALAATMFLSSPIATWAVNQFTFESPDDVASLHAMVFMAANVVALAIGWTIGWGIGGAVVGKDAA
jgi:hypothetical protein